MNQPEHSPFDLDLAATLSRGRAPVVPGFSSRVVAVIRADRLRRSVIRWSSLAAAAACAVFGLWGSRPSEEVLNRQTSALVAREESATFNDLLGAADDLSLLIPVIDKKSSIVDVITPSGF